MNNVTFATAALTWLSLSTQLAVAQTPRTAGEDGAKAAVSTLAQKLEPSAVGTTMPPSDQTSAADADLVDRIRRSVVADRNLSSYAAKVVIASTEGTVRLSGLVQNDGERAQIAAKAAAVAGPRHVVDDLRIMTNVPDGAGLRALLEQASVQRVNAPRAVVAAAN